MLNKEAPNLVTQLNLYIDQEGLLRVRNKLMRENQIKNCFPLILSRNSKLTELVIRHYHIKHAHAGCYRRC